MSDEHKATAVLVALDMSMQTATSEAPELAQRILGAVATITEGGIVEVDGDPSEADVATVIAIIDPLATLVAIDGPQPVEGLGQVARSFVPALRSLIARAWPLVRGLAQRFGRRLVPMMKRAFPRLVRGIRGIWRTAAGRWTMIAGGVLLGARWIRKQLRELGKGATELAFGLAPLAILGIGLLLLWNSDGGD